MRAAGAVDIVSEKSDPSTHQARRFSVEYSEKLLAGEFFVECTVTSEIQGRFDIVGLTTNFKRRCGFTVTWSRHETVSMLDFTTNFETRTGNASSLRLPSLMKAGDGFQIVGVEVGDGQIVGIVQAPV